MGRDASGDQIVGLPTVVAEQQQAQMTIDPFSFVAKDGEATVTIKVSGQASAAVNLTIERKSGSSKGEAQFKSANQTTLPNLQVTSGGTPVIIKGVQESDTKDNLLLKATPTSANPNVTGAERAFSVVAVKKVEWVNEGQLSANSYPDSNAAIGQRIFPDATSQNGQPQNKVKVKATITPADVKDVEVFFRSVDVDDPSSNDKDLDDEKQTQDNHGTPKDGKFSNGNGGTNQTSKKTEANGEVEVEFQVTMQPGDNFRVVATCISKEAIAAEKVKARQDDDQARVQDDTKKDINDDTTTAAAKKASGVLTVWRYLHVEVDSMSNPPDPKLAASATDPERNFITGTIIELEGSGKTVTRLKVFPQPTQPPLDIDDGSPNLSSKKDSKGNGRFENGTLCIGGLADCLLDQPKEAIVVKELDGNGTDFVAKGEVDKKGGKKEGITIPCRLVDAFNGNPFPSNPNQQVTITGISSINHSKKNEFELSEGPKDGKTYTGGVLTVAGTRFTILKVEGKKVTVSNKAAELPFLLVDDDMAKAPFLEKPPKGSAAFALMQESDNKDENLFAVAYVQPVYNLASGQVKFNRNIEDIQELRNQVTATGTQDFKSTSEFWVVYLQGAFQGPAFEQTTDGVFVDMDPDGEALSTWIVLFGETAAERQQDGTLKNIRGSTIYQEVLRDYKVLKNVDCLAFSVAHESGHQFGLPDKSGGIMENCSETAKKELTPKHLKAIRLRSHPQDN